MEPATWDNCRADFGQSYVDLLVPAKGLAVWQAFWTALRSGPFALKVDRGWKSIPPPKSVAWIFSAQEVDEDMVTARVHAGPVVPVTCFNFMGGEADEYPMLQIDCEEMVGAEAFTAVLAVMRYLAAALALPMLAVGEGRKPGEEFLRVSPDGQAEFVPSGSGLPSIYLVPPDPNRDRSSPAPGSAQASGADEDAARRPSRHPRGVPVPPHLADWLGPLDWIAKDPYIEGDIVCPCGQHNLVFHYPGQTHHPPHLAEPIPCVAGGTFVIQAECPACGRQAVVFDHHIHGLSVFLNAADRQGKEPPALLPWTCSACGGTTHRGRVHFRFPDRAGFLDHVEGACGLERWGEGIEWFGMKIECSGCGHQVNPWAGYETL